MAYVILCESTCDLGMTYFERDDLFYLPYKYEMNGSLYPDDFGQTISHHDFYQMMKEGSMPTTSQLTGIDYEQFWLPFLEQGHDILHLAMSSGISGACNNALLMAAELNVKYSNQIKVLDTLSVGSGYGLLVRRALLNKDRGLDLEANFVALEDLKGRIECRFFSTDLSAYVRGGRISKGAAFIASGLKICPIIQVDKEGKLEVIEKIRTKKKAMQECLRIMEELVGLDYCDEIVLSYSDCLEDTKEFQALIQERFPHVSTYNYYEIGAVIGCHTGPGTIGFFVIRN